jgi:hypothetical protein
MFCTVNRLRESGVIFQCGVKMRLCWTDMNKNEARQATSRSDTGHPPTVNTKYQRTKFCNFWDATHGQTRAVDYKLIMTNKSKTLMH